MDDCIFCKILRGEIPAARVYEDDDNYAFLDILPMRKGHTLLISKDHSRDLEETSDETLRKLAPALKKVAAAVTAGTRAEAVTVLLSNGKAAGQEVEHLHFHIVPRQSGDGLNFYSARGKYAAAEMEDYCIRIASAL